MLLFSFIILLLASCESDDETTARTNLVNQEPQPLPSYTFRLAESQPPDYPVTLGDQKFANLVYERTDGRIKIDVFPAGQLGDERSSIELLQLGVIDFSRVSSSPLAEFNNDFGVFSLPYIFNSDDHMWKFLDGNSGENLLNSLLTAGIYGLTYYDAGSRSFFTKETIDSVEDLNGLKIRVPQNKINIDLMKAFGATASPMPYGEVYEALETGEIDGAENNLPSYYHTKAYEVAENYVVNKHQTPPDVLIMSEMTWNKISVADQEIVKQAAMDSSNFQRENWQKSETQAMIQLKANGVAITEVENFEEWKSATIPVIEKYQSDFQEVLKAIERVED